MENRKYVISETEN